MSVSLAQSLRLAAVLGECSERLDIFGHTLTVRISRRGGSAPAQEVARLKELKKDCQFISQHISRLYSELQQKQDFTSLQQLVMEEERMTKAKNLQREERKMVEQRKENLKRQEEEIQQRSGKLKDLNMLAEELKLQLKEKSSIIAHKKEMVVRMSEVELEQTQKKNIQAEKLLEERSGLLQKQLQWEARVHEETRMSLQNRNEGLQKQLLQWQERTEQTLKEMKQQVNNVQCNSTFNFDRLMEKKRMFREMEQVVIEDREKQKKLELQQAEVRAAIKLQAWWRGCMVRHGFSTFRKSENKKGKKKKKPEGKKNKKK
ncbi:dynein regulatory complex protein 9 [Xyrichtys novacula]|uniref:Dynein regulatory complex protein 9 n=1 Tax=Xyrichtys novacula TaxID=13765 RepID=A0AAV1FLI3_XYRNO|nr:dynein regulatory complex protein 9 [Xyrichtys novacula]